MDWLGEAIEDTGHLLLALHPPNILVLWDTYTGKQIWKKVYANETALTSFDFDPFDVSRIAFKSTDCILFINDFNPSKSPVSCGKKLYVSGPITSARQASHSPNRNTTAGEAFDPRDNAKLSKMKIKKFMKDFVLGQEVSSHEQAMAAILECQQIMFHKSARNHLILVYRCEYSAKI